MDNSSRCCVGLSTNCYGQTYAARHYKVARHDSSHPGCEQVHELASLCELVVVHATNICSTKVHELCSSHPYASYVVVHVANICSMT